MLPTESRIVWIGCSCGTEYRVNDTVHCVAMCFPKQYDLHLKAILHTMSWRGGWNAAMHPYV